MVADAIYIDAGHDYDHALADIQAYWDIVRPGGVMFGDDYHLNWIGVVRAVHDFADLISAAVNVSFKEKWLIENPAEPLNGRPDTRIRCLNPDYSPSGTKVVICHRDFAAGRHHSNTNIPPQSHI